LPPTGTAINNRGAPAGSHTGSGIPLDILGEVFDFGKFAQRRYPLWRMTTLSFDWSGFNQLHQFLTEE
jgi:hypothetical protein